MAASDKLILVDNDYTTLETVYQGESLDVNFDRSDLFGETIDPADWTDVIIRLYHKFSKVNVGYTDLVATWSKVAATVTFVTDVAKITMTDDRLEAGQTGIYQYLIEMVDDPIYRKVSGDCFNLNMQWMSDKESTFLRQLKL